MQAQKNKVYFQQKARVNTEFFKNHFEDIGGRSEDNMPKIKKNFTRRKRK